ncbi:DUF7847 domain-containing protein [Luteipulveratus halotolerans]|uniref:DUF7847 domain-containing protein n=1 Tax=Luteipulveratus halotolerans TaxID=1631356 RepID=A0A0L6CJ58_9MICO|nr:hypothetical protein [Luteipulveratus halotolerans]KNX37832.1 hypothetical protein VV01_12805 [Luteipulveratus halotolerans]
MSNSWTSPSGDEAPPPEQRPPYEQNPPAYGQQTGYGQNPAAYGQQPPYAGQPGQPYPPAAPIAGPYAGGPYGGWAPFAAIRPGVIPLRALTLSDIFDGAVRTIRGNPGATLGLSFVISLVVALPAVGLLLGLDQLDPGDNEIARDLVYNLSQQGTSLLQQLGGVVLAGMLTVVLADAVLGRRLSIGGAWSRVKGRLLPLIGMTLLIYLALALLVGSVVLIGVLLIVFVNEVAGVIVLLVGLIGALLAVVFLWVKWAFASACVVLERQGPIAALKRSWALTRGQWWRVFGISLLAVVVVGVIASILLIPFAIGLAITMSPDDPDALPPLGFLLGLQGVSLVINTITAPFIASVTGLLYLDQRIRKEALDVTLIAASQSQQPG